MTENNAVNEFYKAYAYNTNKEQGFSLNIPAGVRQFESGATRDSDSNKLDFEGFLSPFVLRRYAEYLHKHRIQSDGNFRDSDNWQKGIPISVYMKSMSRHYMEVWEGYRRRLDLNSKGVFSIKDDPHVEDRLDSLCALMFNVQGYIYEILKAQGRS